MTRRELDCIGRMFEAVTSVGDPESAYIQILDAACEITDAFGGHFAFCEETIKQGRLVDLSSGDRAAMAKIANDHPHYIFENPIWPHLAAFKGNVLRHLDLLSKDEWENCEFFSGFVRPNRLRDGLCVMFRDPNGSTVWALGLMYDQKMNYKKSTLRTLGFIAPYLSRGIQNLETWSRRWQRCGGLENAANSNEPVVAVKKGRLMFAYGGAEKILDLKNQDVNRSACIQELLRLCPPSSDPGARVHWRAPSGQIFRLTSIALRKDALQLVHLAPVKVLEPGSDEDFNSALEKGLTSREARVFQLMARGRSYAEISKDLRISLHTVRAHIRHIYNKLKVTGYVEAINAVRSKI